MKYLTISLLFLIMTVGASAQKTENAAPTKWQTYTDSEVGFSFAMPKLPLRLPFPDECHLMLRTDYYAYSLDVVYRISVLQKMGGIAPRSCRDAGSFSSSGFFDRLLKNVNLPAQVSKSGLEFVSFNDSESKAITWLVHDKAKKRIFELSVFNRGTNLGNMQQFVDSLSVVPKKDGMEVGEGADQIMGDLLEGKEPPPNTDEKALRDPHKIISQPKARYTEEARRNNLTGNVVLKIALLRNGTVGTVTATNRLPYGLTEEAIKAAKRIVFLPKKVNGQPVSIIITTEYGFNMY